MDYVRWIRSKVGKEPILLNVANAIIINDTGQILLQRRGGHKDEAWSTPGGAIEIGESAQEAVVREVREETSLEVVVESFVGAYTKDTLVSYPNGDQCQIILFSFACRIVGGQLKADNVETLELRFFDLKSRPPLFRKHLEQALNDYLLGKRGAIS